MEERKKTIIIIAVSFLLIVIAIAGTTYFYKNPEKIKNMKFSSPSSVKSTHTVENYDIITPYHGDEIKSK